MKIARTIANQTQPAPYQAIKTPSIPTTTIRQTPKPTDQAPEDGKAVTSRTMEHDSNDLDLVKLE